MPGGRVGTAEYAARVNVAAELAGAGVPAAEAARVLADRFGCSVRQARRYVDAAGPVGSVAIPSRARCSRSSCRRPWRRVRAHARASGRRSPRWSPQALDEFLARGRGTIPARERADGRGGVRASIVTPTSNCRWPTTSSCQQRPARIGGPTMKEGCRMTSAAIYARVSSARQTKDETIGSQLAALRDHAAQHRA